MRWAPRRQPRRICNSLPFHECREERSDCPGSHGFVRKAQCKMVLKESLQVQLMESVNQEDPSGTFAEPVTFSSSRLDERLPAGRALGLSTMVPPFGLATDGHECTRIRRKQEREFLCGGSLSVFICVHLWPIALRSGGWTARLVKRNPLGAALATGALPLQTGESRASIV